MINHKTIHKTNHDQAPQLENTQMHQKGPILLKYLLSTQNTTSNQIKDNGVKPIISHSNHKDNTYHKGLVHHFEELSDQNNNCLVVQTLSDHEKTHSIKVKDLINKKIGHIYDNNKY